MSNLDGWNITLLALLLGHWNAHPQQNLHTKIAKRKHCHLLHYYDKQFPVHCFSTHPSLGVGIVCSLGIVLRLRGWTGRVRIPAQARDFLFWRTVQTGSGAHPASYSMGTRVLSQESSSQGIKPTIHLHLCQG